MADYKMNFSTKTLTVTKAFAAKAMKPNSDEANVILNIRMLIPDLKITYKTSHRTKPHPFRGLSYEKMKTYINCHENSEELMIAFNGIKAVAKSQKNPHNFTCKWFLKQFPDYRDIPTLHGDKIAAVRVVTSLQYIAESNENRDEAIAA